MARPEIWDFPDTKALIRAAAAMLRALALASTKRHGRMALALGADPSCLALAEAFAGLNSPPIDWKRVFVFLTDQQAMDSPDRGRDALVKALVDRTDMPLSNLFAPQPDAGQDAARQYQEELARFFGQEPESGALPTFQAVVLNLDSEGSLNCAKTRDSGQWVADNGTGVCLTFPLMEQAENLILLARAGHKDLLKRVRKGKEKEHPLALLKPVGRQVWFLDKST